MESVERIERIERVAPAQANQTEIQVEQQIEGPEGPWEMPSSDSADGGAAQIRGYAAADAAHMFELFLERRITQDAFAQWLSHYPASGPGRDDQVADEIDNAVLALRALNDGRRPWREVHRELMDCRSRLTGLARF